MYQEILNYLYKRYFENDNNYSNVTSSYWQSIGSQSVIYENGTLMLKGEAFGNFTPPSVFNCIRTVPEHILSRRLLAKHRCPQAIASLAYKLASSQRRIFNYDCTKQALSISHILENLPIRQGSELSFCDKAIRTICVIGDGYGYTGALLKKLDPKVKIVSINLGRTLFFDVFHTEKLFPNEVVTLLSNKGEEGEALLEDNSVLFIEAENYHLLNGLPIDLFINIGSMQEMDNLVIKNYFQYMRGSTSERIFFYCSNRLEKKLPGGEVTQFHNYPWDRNDSIITDELCPWYQTYPLNYPPFWKRFDGVHQHRLVKLVTLNLPNNDKPAIATLAMCP